MPEWGTTKDENHPHPASPVEGEGILPAHPGVSTVKRRGISI